MREPKNKNRTTLTLIGEDVQLLMELQRMLEAQNKFKISYIDIVRRAMHELKDHI